LKVKLKTFVGRASNFGLKKRDKMEADSKKDEDEEEEEEKEELDPRIQARKTFERK